MESERMECPKCGASRSAEQVTCTHCGVVFHKYATYLARLEAYEARRAERRTPLRERLAGRAAALAVPPAAMATLWWGYLALWLAFLVWGGSYMIQDIAALGRDAGFLHNVNLPFHEFGHLLFRPFGEWVTSLGGTLGQLLMPVICGIALLRGRGDTFGASLCLWWFGENFLDIAPYMADARAGQLPLLGGNTGHTAPYGFHDWEYLLGETGLLAYDRLLAAITLNAGRLIMAGALLWGAVLLLRARAAR
ncbi:zinc ribbon domain-containing protein [Arhodomonas sp. KWT2]|nr:zinc ribbon domain-containing protein [Arhodomonas sp. KWT]